MIKYEIKRSNLFKRFFGFGPYVLNVEITDNYGTERERSYHETYRDAEDYFKEVYYYEISDLRLGIGYL